MSVKDVLHELKVHRYPYANTFKKDLLPPSTGYELLEEAIFFAVKHAYAHHYQLVPRFKNQTWFLHCDRMHEDAIDEIWTKELKEKLGDEWEDQTVRESCTFALKVDHVGGKYRVVPTSDIEHNHPPSCHPNAHIDAFEAVYDGYHSRHFGCDNAMNEEYEREGKEPVFGPFEYLRGTWEFYKHARLDGKTPSRVLLELLNSPLLRGVFRYGKKKPGSIFFAHTEGYRYWKTYPEVVIVEDCQYYITQQDKKQWRLFLIRGVDNGDREFPICACITKSDKCELELGTYVWALEQYKQLLKDYEIPEPAFMQTDTGDKFVKAANQVFPDMQVQIGFARRVEDVQLFANIIDNEQDRVKAMEIWTQLVTSNGDMAKFECPKEITSFWNILHKHNLLSVSKDMPFFLQDMEFYQYRFIKQEYPLNEFEIVRLVLKGFVTIYENIDRAQGYLFSLTQNGFGELYENVQHWISETALAAVRDGHNSRNTTGVPSVEDVENIKSQGRKLAPDDFHPKWRNIYSSLHEVPLSGGKFNAQWKEMKTGMGFFSAGFTEGGCKVGTKPPRCEKCRCEGVSDSEDGEGGEDGEDESDEDESDDSESE